MQIIHDIADLLMPRRCLQCGKRLSSQEKHLCLPCSMQLSFTEFHKKEHSPLEKKFWGLFPVGKAVSMFFYSGPRARQLIHAIKYKKNPKAGTYFAEIYADELKEYAFFDGIDGIIPMPIHWIRQLSRGYNQTHYIAQGIRNRTGLPIWKGVVKKRINNSTQTRLNKKERHENVKGIYQLIHPEIIANKHVLLIDDVTTTGSTLISCAQELAKAPNVTISILTFAIVSETAIPALQNDEPEISVYGVPLLE